MDTARLFGFGTSMVLHGAAIAVIAWNTSGPAPVPVEAAAPAKLLLVAPELDFAEAPETDTPLPRGRGPFNLQIGGFRFDYGKIAKRATLLFPFFTEPLSLHRMTLALPRGDGGILTKPAAAKPVEPPRRALQLTGAEIQDLIDKSWSRRERWTSFRAIANLAAAHGPNDEGVLAVLRAYREQNILQPYVDMIIRDPRLWVMLGVAADHVDFIDFISGYASRHPSSKVTTELLFLLDELAQGSADALRVLLDTRGHDLWWTRESNREAYELIVAIQRHYRVQLRKRDVPQVALGLYYDEVRLGILRHIMRTTPGDYRISDALFLSGSIYWKQGRTADALRVWRQLTFDPEATYARASDEIRAVLNSAPNRDGVSRVINRVLAAENSRWLAFSARRLAHFGYGADTF